MPAVVLIADGDDLPAAGPYRLLEVAVQTAVAPVPQQEVEAWLCRALDRPWDPPAGSGETAMLDIDLATGAIDRLAARNDIVIVSFHGGAEGLGALHVPFAEETYYGEPRGDVVRFARSAVDAGANVESAPVPLEQPQNKDIPEYEAEPGAQAKAVLDLLEGEGRAILNSSTGAEDSSSATQPRMRTSPGSLVLISSM